MSKIKHILIWIGIFAYLIFALSFVEGKRDRILCNTVDVNICDSLENAFVRKDDVLTLIDDVQMKLLGVPTTSINTDKLESVLFRNPFIKGVETYKTINGVLKIEVSQRNPIIKIIDYKNNKYYIDKEGVIMPLSKKYASHILVANGNIHEKSLGNQILCSGEDKSGILCDVVTLADYIYSNDFWRHQIQQIYVNNQKEFELAPRVGPHIILFGDINNYEVKFKKLEVLYTKGLSKVGWNDYLQINLKYKNQIICTKR